MILGYVHYNDEKLKIIINFYEIFLNLNIYIIFLQMVATKVIIDSKVIMRHISELKVDEDGKLRC